MKRKIVSWMLILALVISLIPATAAPVSAASYSFDGVKWEITGGVLTVSKGTATDEFAAGEMGQVSSYEAWRSRDDDVTKVVVKDGVTNIGTYAFSNMPNLQEVEIAGSVKTIDLQAFTDSTMKSVKINNGVESIGQEAFLRCHALTDVEIPSSVKTISESAFRECEALTSVKFNEGLETVESNAFAYCSNLADIAFPATIISVGQDAVTGTASYNAQVGSGDFIICGNALIGSNTTAYYNENPCIIPEGVTCIADYAFDGIDIYSMTFPSTLRSIGYRAFVGDSRNTSYKRVTDLDFKNVTRIGGYAFQYWHSIQHIDLSGVTYIGDGAFNWCNALKTVVLADKMDYIGDGLFYMSDSITSIECPSFVKYAYYNSFMTGGSYDSTLYNDTDGDGYTVLNGVLLTGTVKDGASAEDGIVIPDGVTTIAYRALDNFNGATSITVPESVVTIAGSYGDFSITDIFYAGDMNSWNNIYLDYSITTPDSKVFPNATIHCAKSSAVSVEDCTVKMAYTSADYTGSALKPSVTVVDPDGKVLTSGTDYVVAYSNNTNAGTAKVTITGQGEYIGTVEKTFTISKVAASNVKVKLSFNKTNYNGSKTKKPAITVKDANGRVLEADKDYTVNYPNVLGAGNYTVTVNLGGSRGNYSGSKAVTYTVVPAATSTVKLQLSTATNGYDDVVVSWDIVSQASGYYLYYKKNSSSKWSKAINFGKNKRTYTVKGLTTGTKYNFKVVAYWKASDGTKYTSTTYKQNSIYTLKKPANVTVGKSAAAKVKVNWKDINGESGYQIKKMKKVGKKYVAVKSYTVKANVKSKVIAHAKGKQFYYKVRAYKNEKVNGKTKKVYGPWSAVKGKKL